jgi:pimeloyl-ACP methyl ester carboxylesterase
MDKIPPRIISQKGPPLFFLHANGYPPEAYRAFLEPFLDLFQIRLFYLRPFWPGSNPEEMKDWRLFRDDYLQSVFTLVEKGGDQKLPGKIIGMGHSLGAMTTLLAAIQEPDLFHCLVLIEPVLFPRWRGLAMRLLSPFSLIKRIHPLIRGTIRRKTWFESRDAMIRNYRGKPVFSGLSDRVLRDYVDGLAGDHPHGGVSLKYSPAWEARIYETGGIADRIIWRNLYRVSCPVLVIRGEDTYSLKDPVFHPLVDQLSDGTGCTVEKTGHLVPLEAPIRTAGIILDYLHAQQVV